MKVILKLTLIFLLYCTVYSRELRKEIDLRGRWRFEVGDDMAYANPDFDDSEWEKIFVPGYWENFGFPGYDGYAWYRIKIKLPEKLSDKSLYLKIGRVNDVDMVYVNNNLIGSTGGFPPNFYSAHNVIRTYQIPNEFVHFNTENIIAVRVYDVGMAGGIYTGPIGIYSHPHRLKLEMSLSGFWKFSEGDNTNWSRMDYNDSGWKNIMVPSLWESQGYLYLNGYAWYRKWFIFKKQLYKKKLVLVLGKINDIDEVYFNGVRIGSTGGFPGEKYGYRNTGVYERERFYFIPPNLINWKGKNLIAVRVYDMGYVGGIYEGPIGIITRTEYRKLTEKEQPFKNFFKEWFE